MSTEGTIGDALQRFGLKLVSITRYGDMLRTCVQLPATNIVGFVDFDRGSLLAARGAAAELVRYEVRACRELLVNQWLFEQLRDERRDLVWIAKGRECPHDHGNTISHIDRGHWTFHCSGDGIAVAHVMPERVVLAFSGLVEVHQRPVRLQEPGVASKVP